MKKKTRKKSAKKAVPVPTWTTAAGETLNIRDMRDQHLLNSHRMLRRSLFVAPHAKALNNLEDEIRKRDMIPLPVFADQVDEVAHMVKRIAKAKEAADPYGDEWGPGQ